MKPLYILPFDHRGSFLKIINALSPPSDQELVLARKCKQLIYQGFKQAVATDIPASSAAILVDEWLGSEVLKQAKADGFIVCFPLEKSGQEEFVHEYIDWQDKLDEIKPDYAKILLRYNPTNKEVNERQRRQLAAISSFLSNSPTKFLLELLVPATTEQLKQVGSVAQYDNQLRPQLTIDAIKELYNAQIVPDVWKLEGVDTEESMQQLSDIVATKENINIILLGRGKNAQAVEHWLRVGATAPNAIGFAVGRTIFSEAIAQYANHTLTEEQTIEQIAKNFLHFFHIWIQEKNR